MANQRLDNFGAGPAAIPLPVLNALQSALVDWQGQGAGIAELNHRGPAIMDMLAETERLLIQALAIPNGYRIILTPLPARAHFGLIAMNCAKPGQRVSYIDSGHWATLAMQEAAKFADVHVAASAKADHYRHFPARESWAIDDKAAYLHITDNETIEGLSCYDSVAGLKVPVICDMTSSLMTRPLAIQDYGMIYASAQKNLGLAGLCVLIIREDLLERVDVSGLPTACHYGSLAKAQSLYHTPPVFACYALNQTLHWLLAEGGVSVMQQRLQEKAALIYQLIDENPNFYQQDLDIRSRSELNIVFSLPTQALTDAFLQQTRAEGIIGVKGHGSRGGIRISLYNAVTIAQTQHLREVMQAFRR